MKSTFVLPFLAALAAAQPTQGTQIHADGYDYIVVGGGTSGLVVANRLSEIPSVSVLVIESGDSAFSNINVTDVDGYGNAFGTEIDYAYPTVPQTYANNTLATIRAGKGLGGTSLINGMAYTRAEYTQIDAWEKLGNQGWNWSTLWPYYLKSETFQVPDEERVASTHIAFDLSYHGESGPLYIGFAYDDTNNSYPVSMNSTFQKLGVPWNGDGTGGDMVGFSPYPKTINQDLNVRWDSARAYYYPYENRTNLQVLFNTTANKLTWASTNGTATASGVEITSSDGTTSTVKANKEVILAAGSLVSPLLLELSGVGNPDVLSQFGIETVVDLPTVGENLQDQVNNALTYTPPENFTSTYTGGAQFVAYPSASQVLANKSAAAAADLKAKLPAYAEAVAIANGNATRASDLEEFFEMQYDIIFGPQEAAYAEVLVYVEDGTWGGQYWGLLPFTRGSVHIGNANSTAGSVLDPKYYLLDYDLELQITMAKFIRSMMSTEPFSAYAGTETAPGYDAVPEDADDATWAEWVVGQYRSNFHPVGTAAMMPREKGGVVDSDLKVYGTSNVRVVDASIQPFQVGGHLQSTIYAVAERVSDIIKGTI